MSDEDDSLIRGALQKVNTAITKIQDVKNDAKILATAYVQEVPEWETYLQESAASAAATKEEVTDFNAQQEALMNKKNAQLEALRAEKNELNEKVAATETTLTNLKARLEEVTAKNVELMVAAGFAKTELQAKTDEITNAVDVIQILKQNERVHTQTKVFIDCLKKLDTNDASYIYTADTSGSGRNISFNNWRWESKTKKRTNSSKHFTDTMLRNILVSWHIQAQQGGDFATSFTTRQKILMKRWYEQLIKKWSRKDLLHRVQDGNTFFDDNTGFRNFVDFFLHEDVEPTTAVYELLKTLQPLPE